MNAKVSVCCLIIIIILLLIYIKVDSCNSEGYFPCNNCDNGFNFEKNAILNPYLVPYSSTSNADTVYAQEYAKRLKHRNEPDHVPMV